MDVYAVLVTNEDVYDLRVRGQLVNNTWTNFAFRFEKYIDTQSVPYLSRGGLEVSGVPVVEPSLIHLLRPRGCVWNFGVAY